MYYKILVMFWIGKRNMIWAVWSSYYGGMKNYVKWAMIMLNTCTPLERLSTSGFPEEGGGGGG